MIFVFLKIEGLFFWNRPMSHNSQDQPCSLVTIELAIKSKRNLAGTTIISDIFHLKSFDLSPFMLISEEKNTRNFFFFFF